MWRQNYTLTIDDSALFELYSAARWGWIHDVKLGYACYKNPYTSDTMRKLSRKRIKSTLKKAIACYKASPCHYGQQWKHEICQIVNGALMLAGEK